MPFIHGVHDVDCAYLMADKPGWVVITEALGSDPYDTSGKSYRNLKEQGFSTIIRLNNGYAPVGTIPDVNHYDDFAMRCANFVKASQGIDVVIIGNEPNHEQERPYGQPILPVDYAKCFNLCYQQIKGVAPLTKVAIAAVAPWDATTRYPENPDGNWIWYFQDILNSIFKADAITLHTYTHGTDPALITNNDKMDTPFQSYHYNFRAYRDFLKVVNLHFRSLPIYITETDQIEPWADINSSWVYKAYEEIDTWNNGTGSEQHQKIRCLALYRSNEDDQWSFSHKEGVHRDFKRAVARGFYVGEGVILPPTPTPPNPTPPSTPGGGGDFKPDIDSVLIARGVEFHYATPSAGTGYWRVKAATHLDEAEADAVGPDHHILGTIEQNGQQVEGISFLVKWPSGGTEIKSKHDQAITTYNYDFPMSASLNEYSITVNDGNPSDWVEGIGMGAHGNPGIHTSTWIEWEWAIAQGEVIPIPPIDPIPPTPSLILVHPLPKSIITQHFYQNPDNYARFGMPGHNGTDFGGKAQGTPVLAMADGKVVYSEMDQDYGWYVRLEHTDGNRYYSSMYCHLQEKGITAGTMVKAGQTIGKVGLTGNSTGAHLHLEIRLLSADGNYQSGTPMPKGRVDPETFCAERGLNL